MSAGHPPATLSIDCGGTGLKACVLDGTGALLSERVRVRTPYPCPPERLVATIADLVAPLPAYDRVSVGLPGLVRNGVVHRTPHYVTEAGPFTAERPDLVTAWSGYDAAGAFAGALHRPVRVANDAEIQGLAVVGGVGYEVVLTVGTGLGFAHFAEGRLLPKIELSQHPWRGGQTYDQRLGDAARRTIGNRRWSQRVAAAVATLQPVLWWDRLYLGGGNVKHLRTDVVREWGDAVRIVPNLSGLLGGVRLWQHEE